MAGGAAPEACVSVAPNFIEWKDIGASASARVKMHFDGRLEAPAEAGRPQAIGLTTEPRWDLPHHLPFGHHQEDPDEESPHNSLQDSFESFFGGLGDFISALMERE